MRVWQDCATAVAQRKLEPVRNSAAKVSEVLPPSLAGGFDDLYPHEFSGGGRSAFLSPTLSLRPQADYLDETEPVPSMSQVQAQIPSSPGGPTKRSGSRPMISHNVARSGSSPTELRVMYLGKIAEAGPVRGVLEDRSTRTRSAPRGPTVPDARRRA